MERDEDFRRLLKAILVPGTPEPAARLKQKLTAAYLANQLPPFDHKAAGFKRFKDYLLRHGDLVSLEEGSGGDMVVSLRAGTAGPSVPVAAEPPVSIRSEVWVAFSNPDERRLRYFNRTSGSVLHFSADAPERAQVDADPNLVQIRPAAGLTQSAWMRDFLAQASSAELTALPLSSFVEAEYHSSVNAAFTRALGRHAGQWRAYRTRRMMEHIIAWAAQAKIPMSSLSAIPDQRSDTAGAEAQPNKPMSVRERAIRLIEGLSEEELHSTAIPILLATLMVKSQKH